MRTAFLGALLLFTAACGTYQFPGSPPSSNGTVTGRVVAVPCGPVEQGPNRCAGRPVGGLQINFQNGTAAAQTTTTSSGDFSIDLQPGTWQVSMKTYMRIISGPTSVTVTSRSTLVANYVLDSGIRMPLPAAGATARG